MEGKLHTHPRGMGFVILGEGDKERRINLADEASLGTGFPGDTVRVSVHPSKEGESEETGEVTEVVERARTQFVGTVDRNEHSAFLVPDHPKMYTDFFIPVKKLGEATGGDKVLAEFTGWSNPNQNPEARVLRVIGAKGEHETEMQATALEKGFDPTFPKDVHEEAEKMPQSVSESEMEDRRDMRGVTTFTIDPDTAKDFDDALSFQKLESGKIEIGIHIADVSHYVTHGSKVDEEADARATSVYLVDRTIPMLPEALSNEICSLKPSVDRLAFSAVFTLSKNSVEKGGDYKVEDEWFGRTVIHSDRRFTYEEAEESLDKGTGEFSDELASLQNLAEKLRAERFHSGAVGFDTDEIKVELDQDNIPVAITKKEPLKTHALIEEFMLLANRKVAKFVTERIKKNSKPQPFIYRIHDKPDPEKMGDFIAFIRPLGYTLEPSEDGTVASTELNRILENSKDNPEESIIHTAAVRTMSKAVYSLNNIGHYGLAFDYYTHFTSPIRRYPDLAVHRLLAQYLEGAEIPKKDRDRYERLAAHGSDREKDAADAERDSTKYKQVEYMSTRIGGTFKGVVSGLSKGGIFVQEKETLAEGLIRFHELDDDFYVLDEKNYRLVGEHKEKTYNLGDIIDIKLLDTDLEKKQIDYGLA